MFHQPTHGKNTKISAFRSILLFLLLVALYAGIPVQSIASTLLPNGKQTFTNANGTPLASGKVYFYVPGTTTPKNTYQDSGNSVANANPVVLDSAGRAVIYGTGCYRQIVQTSASVTIWDQTTCDTSSTEASWGGTAGGTPNAITVTAANFTGQDGQVIRFVASGTNSGATTINPSSFGNVTLVVDGGSGPVACTGGEIVQNNVVTVVYDANSGVFHLSTLTSVTAGAGLSTSGVGSSGGTGATSVTLTSVEPVNAQTGTTYAFVAGDNAKLVTFSNTSSVAVSIPAATGNFGTGYWVDLLNLNSGVVTLTPVSGTINGASSVVLSFNGHGRLVSDGTNWNLVGGGLGAASSSFGYSGLVVTNTSGSENTSMTVTANYLSLRNTSGFSFGVSSVNVACNFSTNGANGLDTGSYSASTWYFIWVISNGTTTACLGSTSSTAPTMPSGYTFKMRVGANQSNGSTQFFRIKQYDNTAQYVTPRVWASGNVGGWSATTPTWTAVTIQGAFIPTTAFFACTISTNKYNTAAVADLIAAPNNSYTGSSSTNPPPIAIEQTAFHTQTTCMGLESTQWYWASDAAGAGHLLLSWRDNL